MKELCVQFRGGCILESGSVRSEQWAGFKGLVLTQAEAVLEINNILASERANTDSCWAHGAYTNTQYCTV